MCPLIVVAIVGGIRDDNIGGGMNGLGESLWLIRWCSLHMYNGIGN